VRIALIALLMLQAVPALAQQTPPLPLAMQQAGQSVQSLLPPMIEKLQQIQKDTAAQLKAAQDAEDAQAAGAPASGPPPPARPQ
jgi:predicted PurR-regulated permease PerM